MHKFYVNGIGYADQKISITGEDVNHIKNVLRMKPGEKIIVGSDDKKDYICNISSINDEFIVADIIDIENSVTELPVNITLYQGMPKSDKMDFIIQKTIELGVFKIIPVMMDRSVVKLDENKMQKKCERYNGIAKSAAKQSGRGIVPEVGPFMTFSDAVIYAQKNRQELIVPYESAEGIDYTRKVFEEISEKNNRNVGIFIGPEGGFSNMEIETAKIAGAKIITLGHRILRTETAGMCVLSILGYLLEN